MTSSLIDRLNAVSEQVALKRPVRVASTVNLTLSAFQTIDGVTPVASDENLRVLVKDQMTPSENGVYLMTTGSWERTADFDGNRDVVKGTRVPVTEGNIGANKTYVVTAADPIVIDESGITFSEITESLVTSEFAKPQAPIVPVSDNITLNVSAHAGMQIDVDCTVGDRVITLPAAGDMENGDRITIRYAAGTNQVIIACQHPNDAINGATSLALTSRYESLTLSTNGVDNWTIIGHGKPFAADSVLFIKTVSRTLLTPPVSPVPGARYIIAASGAPTGDWNTFANNDVIESNGQGGWIRYSPSESWHAYVEAENKIIFFTGTAWRGLPNTDDPVESTLGYATFQHQQGPDVVGGTATAGAWTARTLQTEIANTITGMSLAANAITFPAGKYLVIAHATFWKTGWTQIRLKSTTTSTAITGPNVNMQATASGSSTPLVGVLNLAAQEIFKLEYFVEVSVGTSDLGQFLAAQTGQEVYASVQVIDLASLQGGVGGQGEQGPQGFTGYKYRFSTTTTQTDPGTGIIRLNNADLSLVTAAVIDATSFETGNPDVSDEIASWNDGGILRICEVASEQNFASYNVISVIDNGGYLSLVLTYRDHATGFANTDAVSLQFTAKGTTGATGSTIPVYDYDFNTATAGDPGSGKLLFNNATLSGATTISIHDNDKIVVDRSADIAAWDDDGSSPNRGYIYLINAASGARVAVFKATGSIMDSTTYQTMPVTYVSGAVPANNTRVALVFVPAGATGAINGSIGATDNVYLRADGTGGTTLQPARASEDDFGKQTINFEHSSTNTVVAAQKISRTSSGTPATGIGVRQEFEVETAAGNPEVAAAIDVISTDVTGASEDFDLSIKLMAAGAAVAEVFRVLSTGVAYLGGVAAAIILKANGGQTLTGGFKVTPFAAGTKSSGTYTPLYSAGNFQTATNGGAHALAPPADDCTIIIQYTNNDSAGAVTTAGFSKVAGSFTTTNGDDFFAYITKVGSFSHLNITALQ